MSRSATAHLPADADSESPPASIECLRELLDSEGTIERVRILVLELAVSSRLVAPDPTNPAAPVVLRTGEFTSLMFGSHKDLLADIALPTNWRRAKLGQLVELKYGKSLPKKLRTSSGSVFAYGSNGPVGRHDAALVDGPCVVVGRKGSSGAVHLVRQPCWPIDTAYYVTPPAGIDVAYLDILLRALQLHRLDRSTAIPGLNRTDAYALTATVPPLDEQMRIVAKVDQLTALCDELEAKQAKKRDVRDRLTKAALAAFTSAETPQQLNLAWNRVAENFAQLITTPDDVSTLREMVLDLGVRGRLSNIEEGDESADALTRELDSLPEQKRRRSSSSSNDPAPLLFEAPSHWAWRPFDQIADIVGGVTKGRDLRGRSVESFPYLRVANVQRGSLDLELMKEIAIPVEELEKYQLQPGDILFTEGGDWDKVGRSAVWSGEISPCLHQNHVFRVRVLLPGLESRWFSMVGNSPSGRRYFEEAAKQTTNLASINMTQLRAFPMPLPPRQEQRRILSTVERLSTICDELEAKLTQRDERARQLADVLVSSVVPRVA